MDLKNPIPVYSLDNTKILNTTYKNGGRLRIVMFGGGVTVNDAAADRHVILRGIINTLTPATTVPYLEMGLIGLTKSAAQDKGETIAAIMNFIVPPNMYYEIFSDTSAGCSYAKYTWREVDL